MGDGYVEMASIHNSGWLMDYMEDEVQATDFIWPAQIITDQMGSSTDLGLDIYQRDGFNPENSCLKKRPRVETYAGPGSKACREKIRRDKLNDKFLELCSVMEPGRPPKTDKVIILSEATRLLNQLRLEMQKLKKSNEELQDSIKTLKAEKTEMKEEKVRLKAEKERMEQAVKGMSMPPPLMPHPAFHPSTAAFTTTGKTIPYHMNYPPPMAMWQWMPPAALDTSQDHVLRPPVA